MTLPDKVEHAVAGKAAPATLPARLLTLEFTDTLKLAGPIAATQLGQVAMMTTDLALIGRLGDAAVAAAALAHTVLFVNFTFGMGLVAAVAPLAAQAFGARDPRTVRRALRVGLWAALLVSLPMIGVLLLGAPILVMLGQAPATADLAQTYLLGLAWGIAPGLGFLAVRGFMGALNRPEPGLWITLAAIPANGILVYWLIHGGFGLPRLELFGAGLGTTLVSFAMFFASLAVIVLRRPFKKYHALGKLWRIDRMLMRRLIEIGAPISVAFLLEYGLFGAAGLLMGLIGTSALAAHQVALQIVAILFMVPFGIGMAATVRVGHAGGREEPSAVNRAGFVAVALAAVFMSAMTLAVIVCRFAIARIFFGEAADDAGAAIELSAKLLLVGATFFIADGIQTVMAGALRGLNDTRVPLLFAATSYWLIGFPAACLLAFRADLGAIGVWLGLSAGTAVYAVLLSMRFQLLARRLPIA